MLLVNIGIVGGVERPRGEHAFIQVDYLIAIRLQLVDPLLHIQPPLLVLLFLLWLDLLGELDPLSFDPVNAVDLTKQRRVDAVVAEVSVEKHTPPRKRDSTPQFQSLWICEILNMFLSQETVAIPLPYG